MQTECEICKTDIEVVGHVCCTGPKHKIECSCGGEPYYEGHALCSECKQVAEYLDKYDHHIGYFENHKHHTIFGDNIAEAV
jgi:hypothetical protein